MRNTKNGSRLDLTDRLSIEVGLSKGEDFKTIADRIKRHPASISREVRANRTEVLPSYPFGCDCQRARTCAFKHLCGRNDCNMYCHSCSKGCFNYCESYRSIACKRHEKPPYVCNNCEERRTCIHKRYFYSSKRAHAFALRRRSESHQGIRISEKDFDILNDTIAKCIKKGQPISHICASNPDKVKVCERTVYNYISRGKMKTKLMDLRRQVRYKKRRKEAADVEKDVIVQNYRKGRSYADFLACMEDFPESSVVEMDTVKGKKGKGPTLLTMLFRRNCVMLLFLLPDCTQSSVVDIFNFLEAGLGLDRFRRLFPVILTDNGPEFKNVDGLELNPELMVRTKVYYCDPMASWQKARLEKNHEFIRYVIPKGTDLSKFNDSDISVLMNHINSTRRRSMGGNSPYEMVVSDDEDMKALMRLLRLEMIHPSEVYLNKDLLKLNR